MGGFTTLSDDVSLLYIFWLLSHWIFCIYLLFSFKHESLQRCIIKHALINYNDKTNFYYHKIQRLACPLWSGHRGCPGGHSITWILINRQVLPHVMNHQWNDNLVIRPGLRPPPRHAPQAIHYCF